MPGKLNADYPIVTPNGGTVLKREITFGQVIQPADPAFTIADLSTVWITARVPEQDAADLKAGMNVHVAIPALPDKDIVGRLSYVAPRLRESPGTSERGLSRMKMKIVGRYSRRTMATFGIHLVRLSNQDYGLILSD